MIKTIVWEEALPEEKNLILQRAQADMTAISREVTAWIQKVRSEGDSALEEYVRRFDNPNFSVDELRVTEEDFEEAYKGTSKEVLEMIRKQIVISRRFHEAQMKVQTDYFKMETVPGVWAGFKKVPIQAVGLYVPAGKAPLPTVAQILTVAAKAAGVPRAVICFAPTAPHYEILVAAREAGADEVYRVGGIAAIAALAYGTESIAPVYKIVGPGSPYVQVAKLQVVGRVGIDMLSGPSEALIMADEAANPRYLAADILARCEHGPDSAGVLVTDSRELAAKVEREIAMQAPLLSRQQYIHEALGRYSALIIVKDQEAMIEFANEYGAEHLEIQMKEPNKVFEKIRHAGSVFLGDYAPVAVGDYASGTNHCLPTGVATKFASPVSVETFLKTIEFQELTREGLKGLAPIVKTISGVEGLDAHWNSVAVRG